MASSVDYLYPLPLWNKLFDFIFRNVNVPLLFSITKLFDCPRRRMCSSGRILFIFENLLTVSGLSSVYDYPWRWNTDSFTVWCMSTEREGDERTTYHSLNLLQGSTNELFIDKIYCLFIPKSISHCDIKCLHSY